MLRRAITPSLHGAYYAHCCLLLLFTPRCLVIISWRWRHQVIYYYYCCAVAYGAFTRQLFHYYAASHISSLYTEPLRRKARHAEEHMTLLALLSRQPFIAAIFTPLPLFALRAILLGLLPYATIFSPAYYSHCRITPRHATARQPHIFTLVACFGWLCFILLLSLHSRWETYCHYNIIDSILWSLLLYAFIIIHIVIQATPCIRHYVSGCAKTVNTPPYCRCQLSRWLPRRRQRNAIGAAADIIIMLAYHCLQCHCFATGYRLFWLFHSCHAVIIICHILLYYVTWLLNIDIPALILFHGFTTMTFITCHAAAGRLEFHYHCITIRLRILLTPLLSAAGLRVITRPRQTLLSLLRLLTILLRIWPHTGAAKKVSSYGVTFPLTWLPSLLDVSYLHTSYTYIAFSSYITSSYLFTIYIRAALLAIIILISPPAPPPLCDRMVSTILLIFIVWPLMKTLAAGWAMLNAAATLHYIIAVTTTRSQLILSFCYYNNTIITIYYYAIYSPPLCYYRPLVFIRIVYFTIRYIRLRCRRHCYLRLLAAASYYIIYYYHWAITLRIATWRATLYCLIHVSSTRHFISHITALSRHVINITRAGAEHMGIFKAFATLHTRAFVCSRRYCSLVNMLLRILRHRYGPKYIIVLRHITILRDISLSLLSHYARLRLRHSYYLHYYLP